MIPAILYYVTLFLQTDLQAARDGIARIDEDRIPPRAPVLKAGWIFILPFVVIIVCLFSLNLSPPAAALWAAVALIPIGVLIGYRGKRMRIRQITATISETGVGVVEIVMIGATAGIIMGVLNITGLGFGLTLALGKFAGGNLPILLILAALVCIVLGMGMPTLGVYILVALLDHAVAHRSRSQRDRGAYVCALFRHDVAADAADRDRRVRRGKRRQG